ncbi:MAG: TolC family protein [Acidobacteriaceae bacterium]
MTIIFPQWRTLGRAIHPASRTLLLAAMGGAVLAASAQTPQSSLPQAPSALVAARNEALAKPPGSGFVFSPSRTFTAPGGFRVERAGDAALPLSLDDAISIGLARNVRLKYDQANLRAVNGDSLGVLSAIIPNLSVNGQVSKQELDLAALGFQPSTVNEFLRAGLLPPGYSISQVVKFTFLQGSLNASQVLFNLPDYEVLRGLGNETRVMDLNRLTDRENLVLQVGMQYLQILSDQANLRNAQAQQRSAQVLFDQAEQKFKAGTGTSLDALRGQVEFQQQEQYVEAARNQLDKDVIQLTRQLGLPAEQKLTLTDTAPFSELAEMDLDAARITAYRHRKDYLSLLQQIALTQRELKAVKYQRLPTLAFNGNYGVIGLTSGPYHGDFIAEGSLNVPIFREAAQRGEQDVVQSQLTALHQQLSDLRVTIDAQIRTSMLDVHAAQELVKVAQSNVKLAQQELSDEQQRFAAGVDDNLPVVDAEAAVASADAQLVSSLYQYNLAKLNLARNTGVVESRYRAYLGRQ